ncbi:MAG TPA: Mut7-C RNAse domain-containing protein [Thermodesulfovibrionales bacterium]|nr:Mut7-C RNAse domain-containing protein [Thermodesulfovibrionales bacterium]
MKDRQGVYFVADAMLGRLARWLRLLGFDTLYDSRMPDGDLLRIALREGRVLLTRDSHFEKMKALENLFMVHSDNTLEQLIEVLGAFGSSGCSLDIPGRCSRCNGALDRVVEKGEVRDSVPEYVFLLRNDFLRCRACGHIYWEGTHLKRFRMMIDGILKKPEAGKVR